MKNLEQYIQEKYLIDTDIELNDDYDSFGNGDFEQLDIIDFVNDKFNIQMREINIINFYDILHSYKIKPHTQFWHIPNENVDTKIATKIEVLSKKDPKSAIEYMNIDKKNGYNDNLQISFRNLPKFNMFIVCFVAYRQNHLVNEYFLLIK